MPTNHLLPRRVLSGVAIAPLFALLACASGGAKSASSEPPRPRDTTSPPLKTDGKTTEDLFAGKFPGVTATPAPGGGLQIRIRGGSNSFYGGSEPLYVLDDTPLPTDGHGVVFINPNDIEKIEVLKNPSDTAIYGMRGGNGVIRITTKRPGRRRPSSGS